ncbi:hypothetical protein [Curtobacterium sp. MCBD17_028]|uniref:hypothetical protein n=1 Tax=Curtobacterium sp. MCBD17_028 TaxID=2175670 RepID=UPI000DA97A64|nr:hypothetical protein [Curtobacterium sp. MCBD17_028]PZE23870.1 hypothetical protein DEI86_13585 [Curtobacterium sp. MCBD17_028]
MPDEEWWTKRQACRHLQITAKTFERYVQDGMPTLTVDRRVFVKRDVVQAEYRRRRLAEKATRATP